MDSFQKKIFHKITDINLYNLCRCIFNISLCNFYSRQSYESRHGIKTEQEIDLIQDQNIDNKFSSIDKKKLTLV